MITIILKIAFCQVLFLSFYLLFLEREAIHQFKRVYLVMGLLLSVLIPMLPTGFWTIFDVSTDNFHFATITAVSNESETMLPVGISYSWMHLGILVYVIVAFLLLLNFIRNINIIMRKRQGGNTTHYDGVPLVLLNESTLPHTFLNTIFVSYRAYENDEIDEKLLRHECAHARELHSLDILLIELFKVIFWFNPFLRRYKNAIQLNHEFIADQSVIKVFNRVGDYQVLLYDFIKYNNQNYLASNINFQLTKKRFNMMTKKSSQKKKASCIAMTLSMIACAFFIFGQPLTAQDDKSSIDKDKYFEHSTFQYIGEDGKTYVKPYKSLPSHVKAKIPLPPPPPPPPPGVVLPAPATPAIRALPAGTVIHLKENGSLVMAQPGKAPDIATVPPPPPPPPAPKSIEELVKDGATFFIDGKSVKGKKVLSFMKDNEHRIHNINMNTNDGSTTVYITTKK